MNRYHPKPCPYKVKREGQKIILDNEYTRWVHDLDKGGELVEAIVKNGTNTNLLVAPQQSALGIMPEDRWNSSMSPFTTTQKPALACEVKEEADGVQVILKQALANDKGEILQDVKLEHTICYSPWGYGQHRINLHVTGEIKEFAHLQIGTLFIAPHMDQVGLRPNSFHTIFPYYPEGLDKWRPLGGGKLKSDNPVSWYNVLPLSALLMQRGVEGIEYCLGDNLTEWERVGEQPGRQQFYLAYSPAHNGYMMRFCPFDTPDSLHEPTTISGDFTFDFRLALPYVKPNMLPIEAGCCGIMNFTRGSKDRWPRPEEIKAWSDTNFKLMRWHNDGDAFKDGIYWRATCYPPYPPEEMKILETMLADMTKAGIAVVPYFSPLEYHPDAPDFEENSPKWFRMSHPGAKILHNWVFGAQMCMSSGWLEKRKVSIKEVLDKHPDFKGIYYDHSGGKECYHPDHTKTGGHHWSHQAFQELVEWSHGLTGPDSEVYLHMTGNENFAAENVASFVITEELSFGGNFGAEIFTPHVHFLNNVPREVCDRMQDKKDTDRRKFGMCAALNHASVDAVAKPYLDLSMELQQIPYAQYRRHSVQGEGRCQSRHPETGASIYWNDNDALLLVANLSEEKVQTSWEVEAGKLGWEGKDLLGGKVELQPLELAKVKISK